MHNILLRANPGELDDDWTFFVSLQSPKSGFGKHVAFTPKAITLDMTQYPTNRMLHGEDLSKFVLTSFSDFRFPDTSPSVARDYMVRFFKAGLTLNGVHYRFYGHSNSQLRSRSCYLREAKLDRELDQRISRLGEFDKILNVAKRAKRIGLLFSSASIDWTLLPQFIEDIGDIRSGEELFSDGCGLISKRLAMQLSRRKQIVFHGKNYTPRVYQIRYKGYKGVLMLHPDLDAQKQALVQFRASQKKFTATGDNIFSVVDYSVPYAFGRLNDDVIVLLASLGISTETLLLKQTEYFDWIAKAGVSWEHGFAFLASLGQFRMAEKLLLEGMDSSQVKSKIHELQNSELAAFHKRDKEQFRTRMLIHKSRILFGICDPYQVLRGGEVYVRISVPRKGETTLTQTDLLVVRNPCLHPGDCLKLRAVDNPRLSHLVDCIVFPTVGKRAAPSMSSGGDLDGDKFLVVFDPDLVPTKIAESYTYPSPKEHTQVRVSREDLAKHFASYNNSSVAQVAKLHRKWVRCSPDGAMSSQCQELNALHSLSVDGGRIRIPERLKQPPNPEGPYVLDVLANAAKQFSGKFVESKAQSASYETSTQPEDARSFIVQLLSLENFAGSEYELVTIALNIARKHGIDFRGYLNHIDFSALTTPQKQALSLQIKLSPEEAPYVWNSLLRSDIVRLHELQDHTLGGPLRLQRLYSSQIQGRSAFFEYLRQSMEDYIRKLIILKTDDRFSIGIFVKGNIPWNEDRVVDENLLICSFMPHTGSGQQSPYRQTTKGYQMHCNDNTMEIFNGKRGDTFIFVTRPPEQSGADIATSIALQKISKHVQQQCGRVNRSPVTSIEIHVISNRDRISHQAFDLRFEHVQTEEYIRRFDHCPTPYTPNSLSGFDWSKFPIGKLFFNSPKEKSKQILTEASEKELDDLMNFSLRYRAEEQAFWIFEALLDREQSNHGHVAFWISQHPPLAYVILKKYLTDDVRELPPAAAGLTPAILRGVIRSANNLGIASLAAIEKLASDVNQLDLRNYIDLLWLACCSIRPRSLVQEVLMVLHECRAPGRAEDDVLEYAHKHALAIAFDRAEEAADECPCDDAGRPTKQRTAPMKAKLVPVPHKSEEEPNSQTIITDAGSLNSQVMAHVRIDAPTSARIHSHVRLQVSSPAVPVPVQREVVDAVVVQASKGEIRLELMHPLPPEYEQMDWNLYPAGSVATAKAMMDAVLKLAEEEMDSCRFSQVITRKTNTLQAGTHEKSQGGDVQLAMVNLPHLNNSQCRAVLSTDRGLNLIWGPPGTGKTTVIVQILLRMLQDDSDSPKILMTASTHNAVDNVLERFIHENDKLKLLSHDQILRVATDGSKVAKTLQQFTIDARVGGNISENPRFLKQAEKRLKEAVIVFTTCAGSGLGIMRKVDFGTVLIDEASQVTEACALIPLVKGCHTAVLVGDHVQLRPNVKPMGKALEFDVSLLERLYRSSDHPEVSRTMLEIQYRFSDDIGRFPSNEFYEGRLRSGLPDNNHEAILRASAFPWPQNNGRVISNIFVPCASEEDFGRSSKRNTGQVALVKHIISLLQQFTGSRAQEPPSLAVLTPYSRQATELRAVLSSNIAISTIDGFQGRESDIIIFSTVRCNAEGDIGFVEDARRLNVAWTRCKFGLIVVGDRRTLGIKSPLWQRAITSCRQVEIVLPDN